MDWRRRGHDLAHTLEQVRVGDALSFEKRRLFPLLICRYSRLPSLVTQQRGVCGRARRCSALGL